MVLEITEFEVNIEAHFTSIPDAISGNLSDVVNFEK